MNEGLKLKRAVLYITAWLFIFLVMILDIVFLSNHMKTINDWEINPLVVLIYGWFGLAGCIFLRLGTVIFFYGVCCYCLLTNNKWSDRLLLAVTTIHLSLLIYYVHIFWSIR